MKRQIFRNGAALLLAGMAGSLCSCDKGDGADGGREVRLSFHTKVVSGSRASESGTARLLFWSEGSFHDNWIAGNGIVDNQGVRPRYTVQVNGDLDNYSYANHIYYETPYTYPLTGESIHATGYGPDAAITPDGLTMAIGPGYESLLVNDDSRNGLTDFLSCDGCFEHSADNRDENNFLQEDKELKFRHLTAKITFIGQRHREMIGYVGVRNVRIAVHGTSDEGHRLVVPARFGLVTRQGADTEDDRSTYCMTEAATYAPGEADSLKYTGSLPQYDYVELGSIYVLSDGITFGTGTEEFDPITGQPGAGLVAQTERPTLTFDVLASLYNSGEGHDSGEAYEDRWLSCTVTPDLWTTFSTGDKFLPGYEYRVYVTFDRMGVDLKAAEAPWNSEILHEFPIMPGQGN